MNSYLLHIVGKWISLLIVSLSSLFGISSLKETEVKTVNNVSKKGLNIVYTIVKHDTIVNKTKKLPLNTTRVLVAGTDGMIYENDETGEIEIIKTVVDEIIEKGIGSNGEFVGRLTAYGPDCKTCNGLGNVACPFLPDGSKFNLIEDGIIYNDKEYGEVRVLAAANEVFSYGTIIKVSVKNKEPFLGIVLDTGGALNRAWEKEKKIIIDLAFETEKDPLVNKTTSDNVKYDVIRWGW